MQRFPLPLFLSVLIGTTGLLLHTPSSASEHPWQHIERPDFAYVQPLSQNEIVELDDTVLHLNGRIFWSGHRLEADEKNGKQKQTFGLFYRDEMGGGGFLPVESRIRGMSAHPDGNMLVRTRDALCELDPKTGTVLRRFSLPVTGNRQPIGIWKGQLFLLEKNRLHFYKLPGEGETNLEKLGESNELPLERVQRVVACSNQLMLWSSFGGSKIVSIPAGVAIGAEHVERKADVSHRLFWKMACRQGNLATLDVGLQTAKESRPMSFQTYLQRGSRWLLIRPDMEQLGDGGALRHSRKSDLLEYRLTGGDGKPFDGVILLPVSQTLSQQVLDEEFPLGGDLRQDRFGNRALFLKRSDLVSGAVVYRAHVFRYKVEFDLEKHKTSFDDLKVPESIQPYLVDAPMYRINDPGILSRRDELLKQNATIESYANGVYALVRRTLVYKQDGRFDPAPVVLANGHGSCTEHSYAQIALLRSAGIPARMAWNWLPTGDEPAFNHKIAEVWTPEYGWIPAEPLSSPRINVGTVHGYHLIFAELERPGHEFIRGGDRLISFANGSSKPELKIVVMPQQAEVSSRSLDEDVGLQQEASDGIRLQPRTIRSNGEQTVE